MPRPVALTVSRPALRHNLDAVLQQLETQHGAAEAARPKVWAVIKADAYGHGISHAVSAFSRADGLAMLDLDEAIQCRQAGWTRPILLLEGFFEPADLQVVDEFALSPVLHCPEQFDMLAGARLSRPVDAWLKLNTGMNRLGFMPGDYSRAWQRVQELRNQGAVGTIGKMTHFSRADDDPDVTRAQLALFDQVTADLPGPVSVCNSAATLTPEVWTAVRSRGQQWVRPGVCLYGGTPFADRSAASLGLQPGQTLGARLLAVRDLPAGAAIGYGHEFVARQPVRMGVVACGYADGYPRLAGSGTPVTVDGVDTQLLGRVSMDMLAVDLTPVPGARPGSEVILWGEGGPPIDAVAAVARTIGYELMCAVAPRVPRHVI